MKKKLIGTAVALILAFSLTLNVYAAVQWKGSKDVQEAKDNIIVIQELFNAKNERISALESELENQSSEHAEALKQAEKDVKEINRLLDDVVKENSKWEETD